MRPADGALRDLRANIGALVDTMEEREHLDHDGAADCRRLLARRRRTNTTPPIAGFALTAPRGARP